MTRWIATLSCLCVLSSGCVAKQKHDVALAERDVLAERLATLDEERAAEAERAAAAEEEVAELSALEAEMRRALGAALARMQEMEEQNAQMVDSLQRELMSKSVEVEEMKTGLRIRLESDILFDSGKVTPNAEGAEILRRAGEQLAEYPYQVIVLGHTDDVPVGKGLVDRYPSNWELAAARAASVGRILLEAGVKGEQLAIGSRASFRPIASNDTPEGRAENRRIEILVRFIEMVETDSPL